MIVHEPELLQIDGRIVVSARVAVESGRTFPQRLWFSLPERDAAFVEDRGDGFAVALLPLAMALGEDLEVRGSVCPRLAYGIEKYQRIFQAWFPKKLSRVRFLRRLLLTRERTGSTGVCTAFSGGVDSFYTLKAHLGESEPNRPHRVSHALFVHGFDIPLEDERSYHEAAGAYEAFLETVGVRLIRMSTNARAFTKPPGWEIAHGAVLIGSALLLGRLLSRFYVPSSRSDDTLIPWGTHPGTDPLLSTHTIQVIHDAGQFTRMYKIRALAGWAPTYRLLRTCYSKINGLTNCCRCDNCIRTMTGFEAVGALASYSTFPLPLERRHVRRALVLSRHERTCAKQVIQLARVGRRADLLFDQRYALVHSSLVAALRWGGEKLRWLRRKLASRIRRLRRSGV